MSKINEFVAKLPGFHKALVALAGLVVHVVVARYGADSQTALDVIALLTAVGVYQVRNG